MTTSDTDYQSLRAKLCSTGTLYDDPDFPAVPRSVFHSKYSGRIFWKRPKDICSNPEFFVDGATRFDLDQGLLGNCWYVAAAATLTTRTEYFQKVVPRDQDFGQNYAGIFHFWFWRFGKWEEVIIDDRLPTDKSGYLQFCNNRTQHNEFWSALMEKAYAKIHGCYEALDAGYPQDALVDFTGGLGHTINLAQYREKIPDSMFDTLLDFHSKGSMLGSGIFATRETMEHRKDNGLVKGHAYSITKLLRVKQPGRSVDLVRLRNPWGEKEWNGPWSDGSKEWSSVGQATRQSVGLVNDDNGEFWMSFSDWIQNFDQMQACHLSPDAQVNEVTKWNKEDFHSCWLLGFTAGGCGNPPFQRSYWENPQFVVELESAKELGSSDGDELEFPDGEESWIVISLMQKPPSGRLGKNYHNDRCSISFDLYKVKKGEPELLEVESYQQRTLQLTDKGHDYESCREMSLTFRGEPGTYVIIPSTFRVGVERDFLLRIYSEMKISGSEMDKVSSKPSAISEEMFHKHCGPDHAIDCQELLKLMNETFASVFSPNDRFDPEVCRNLLCMWGLNIPGRLLVHEMVKMWTSLMEWKKLFNQFAQGSSYISERDIGEILKSIGYTTSRRVVWSVVVRYADREGHLSFNNVITVMSRIIYVTDMFKKVATQGQAVFDQGGFMQMALSF